MVNDSIRTPKIIGGLPYRSAGSDAVSQDRMTVPNPRSPTFLLIKRGVPSKLEGRLCARLVERKAVRGRRLKHVAIASGGRSMAVVLRAYGHPGSREFNVPRPIYEV